MKEAVCSTLASLPVLEGKGEEIMKEAVCLMRQPLF